MSLNAIKKSLRQFANPSIAEHSQRFFKTGEGEYGEGDKFLGIRVPVLRKLVKEYRDATLDEIQQLLKSEYHEERLFSLLLLVDKFTKANVDDQTTIYNFYINNTRFINNWDLVDSSAHKILGVYLANRDRGILYELVKSNILWERRISVMSTFEFIRNQQFEDTLKLSAQLIEDKEDLIHKVVGWMLREIGKRDIDVEKAFLKTHYKNMPRTMLRYAIEKFPQKERKLYLAGDI